MTTDRTDRKSLTQLRKQRNQVLPCSHKGCSRKLAMSQRDKTNMAWKLTAYTDYSKSRVARECGVGERTVANMRQVKRQLEEMGRTISQMMEMTWQDAQLDAKGEERPEVDQDAALEKRAKAFALSLAKTLGDRPHKDPEAFARALQMLDERLPVRLFETKAWQDPLSDFLNVLKADDEFSDY